MRTALRTGAAVGALALSLVLAACGGDGHSAGEHSTAGHSAAGHSAGTSAAASGASSPAADGTHHNAADVSFAQDMIVHHRGAIQMAQLAPTRAASPQVKDLARRIEAAQAPEIDQMTGWLKAWGSPASAARSEHAGHSSTTASGPAGMMSDADLTRLQGATGAAFDRLFLEGMTAHHQGAIEMARTEQATGADPAAKALARSIDTAQTAEIAEMRQLLDATR